MSVASGFVLVLILAVIVEALIQVVKGWVPAKAVVPDWLWPVVGAVLGVLLCVLGRVDVLSITGVQLGVPWVGMVLTGVLISRGASFVHDLWAKITEYKGISYEHATEITADDGMIAELAERVAEEIKRQEELPRRVPPEDPDNPEA